MNLVSSVKLNIVASRRKKQESIDTRPKTLGTIYEEVLEMKQNMCKKTLEDLIMYNKLKEKELKNSKKYKELDKEQMEKYKEYLVVKEEIDMLISEIERISKKRNRYVNI